MIGFKIGPRLLKQGRSGGRIGEEAGERYHFIEHPGQVDLATKVIFSVDLVVSWDGLRLAKAEHSFNISPGGN
jgi:hypothetical protein